MWKIRMRRSPFWNVNDLTLEVEVHVMFKFVVLVVVSKVCEVEWLSHIWESLGGQKGLSLDTFVFVFLTVL